VNTAAGRTGDWREIADRVWVGRFEFLDQTIGVVAGSERVLIIDTRSTRGQGAELRAAVRALTPLPHLVANTHHHWDHVLGNAAFRPCEAWGHERCAITLLAQGEAMKARVAANFPALADDLATTPIDPPERTFAAAADLDLGGRAVALRHLGRGHTDNDIVLAVEDAAVVFAGDLIEQGAAPSAGDGFPLEWPATLGQVLDLGGDAATYVPGHGQPVDADFVRAQLADIAFVAEAARRTDPGTAAASLAGDVARHLGWPEAMAAGMLERALGQVRGAIG
jgi:glyoxylase-like metal-dependent hydrolase (beta-lactamase superfamily II)